jgi:branched-subunit amino acid ABC-type transport system permease component
MRAVADNPQLALVRGIESPRVIRWTWFIAGVLLAVGGVLIGMDRALEPLMGSNYLVAVFAAAILGGLGSPLGAFVGAMLIGIVSELSTLVMPPNYRIGIPLVVIAVVLIFRPQGLFGQPHIRK